MTLAKKSFRCIIVCMLGLLYWGRVRNVFEILPADPGIDRVREIKTSGLMAIASQANGFLDISGRLMAMCTQWIDLRNQAIALSFLTVFVNVMLGYIIFFVISEETSSKLRGFFSSVVFVCVPAAALSTIGNHGSLKWPLFATLGVILSAPNIVGRFPKTVLLFTFFVGMSNPFAIIAGIPIFLPSRFKIAVSTSFVKWVRFALIATTVIQFITWKVSLSGLHVYGAGVYRAWPGMGVLWYWVWLGPPACALVGLVGFLLFRASRAMERDLFPVRMVLISLAIFTATYLESGIKDSMSVASQVLALIGLMLILVEISKTRNFLLRALSVIGITLVFATMIRWYPAQGNFYQGLPWTTLTDRARLECDSSSGRDPIVNNGISNVDITCSEIQDWD